MAFWLSDGLAEAGTNPEPFSSSRTSNWVARKGGLPTFIQHVAHDIAEKSGKSVGSAIAIAISQAKKWAAKGNKQAARAIAQWEKMKEEEGVSEEALILLLQEDLETVALVRLGDPVGEAALTADELFLMERDVAAGKRRRLAKKGKALDDGSFPMETPGDVRNARRAIGRAAPGKRPAVRRLIKKRERALGIERKGVEA